MSPKLSKKHLTTAGLIASLCMTAIPSIANAAMTNSTWTPANKSLTKTGEAFTKYRDELVRSNEIIFTSGDTSNGLLFSCINNKLRVSVTTRPKNWQSVLKKTSRRGKTKSISLALDDADTTNIGYFIYKPTLKTLNSRNAKQAVRLYNAVIKGQKITLDMGSKGSVVITPPKPNSAFADFGSQCGIGRHK